MCFLAHFKNVNRELAILLKEHKQINLNQESLLLTHIKLPAISAFYFTGDKQASKMPFCKRYNGVEKSDLKPKVTKRGAQTAAVARR